MLAFTLPGYPGERRRRRWFECLITGQHRCTLIPPAFQPYCMIARHRMRLFMSPSVYIIAGPNGAGKTTFAREFLPNYADCKNFINADLIAQGVSPFSPEEVAFRAGRLMIEEINSYVKRGASFGFETTLSGRSYLNLIRD